MVRWILLFTTLAAAITAYLNLNTSQVISVSELNQRSYDFDQTHVDVVGFVAGTAGILGLGGFILSDGKSDVLVLSDSEIPRFGDKIEIEGLFKKAIILNSLEYNVIYLHGINQ